MRTRSLVASALVGALAGLTDVTVAGAQSGCAELGGNVQSGNVCHVYADTPAYAIDLRFGTDYPDAQPVTDYLTQNRDRIVNAAQAPGARNLPYMMSVTSQTYSSGQRLSTTQAELGHGEPPHGTQSLVLKNFQSVEGAPVGTRYKSFTYNLNQNRPVTFENLFAPGTNPMDSIYPIVAADLARQHIARHFHLSPGVGRDPAYYQNFAITDDTVIFFFDTGEFLSAAAGDFSTPVSRANLPPLQL